MFTNEKRTRYYGKRVGDRVRNTYFNTERTGTVSLLGPMDNNSVLVSWDGGVERFEVAEHIEIIDKVEDAIS